MKRVVVVGGGIAGLATALQLRDRAPLVEGGLEVVVLEGSGRVGGNIRTEREDGFTVEWGPNGYLDNAPETPKLIERIGLTDRVQPADARAAKRFLYRGDRLHALPLSPAGFFKSPVLSLSGRLRVLKEPLAAPKPAGLDETVGAFASRRIGPEAARVLVDAMVSGVFAGDVDQLSLQSAFPKMAKMEAEHGSLVKAMMAAGKEKRKARKEGRSPNGGGGPAGPGGHLTSFRGGLDSFTDRLAEVLGTAIHFNRPIRGLRAGSGDGSGPVPADGVGESARWILETDYGDLSADAVVLTQPARSAGPVLAPLDPVLAETVLSIPAASLAVVGLAYDAAAIGGEPDGFGFLVPRGQAPRVLGCLWDSSTFPGRAPEGKVLVRAMIGGAHDPEAVRLPDEELLTIVRGDLETTMRLRGEPERAWIFRHELGIAQYNVGHQEKLNRIHERLAGLPGLFVAGSSYYGVAMNACIEKAVTQAEEILASV